MYKDKIIDYLKCDDKYNNLIIPPSIFYIILAIIVMFIVLNYCLFNAKENNVKHLDLSLSIDSVKQGSVENNKEIDAFVVANSKYWSAKDTKLPVGIIYAKDYAHGTEENPTKNFADNYVTVKGLDGKLIITKDIDDDLYLNLNIGDTIK